MKVTIEKELGRYIYWVIDNDLSLRLRFRQLHAKHYDASAHLKITALDPDGIPRKLYGARTPITTDTAHKRIADRVQRLVIGDEKHGDMGMRAIFGMSAPILLHDWSATINNACEEILETYYAGIPPLNLYEEESEDDDVWRIPGLLSEDTNLIYGQSGSGKSYLALVWGQAIQHGKSVCGLRTIQGNVCLIDYETTPSKMRRRLKRVDAGLNVEGKPMLYIPASVPMAQMVEPLQDYVTQHNIDFLIVDSLARACGGRITDEEGVGNFFEAIRQLERPCLIIHHTNRGDEYYGSPYIRANARNLWRLRSVKNEGSGKLSIQLEQEKENDGPGIGTLGFVLDFVGDPIDPDSVELAPQDASLVPELRKYLGLTQRLEAYLEETPNHRIEINEIPVTLGLSKKAQSTLRHYVWSLRYNTSKYVTLPKVMHTDLEYLCLNTTLGYEGYDPKAQPGYNIKGQNGVIPEETTSLIQAAIDMGGQVVSEPEEEGVTI